MLLSVLQDNFSCYTNALIQRKCRLIAFDGFNTVTRVFNAQVCIGMVKQLPHYKSLYVLGRTERDHLDSVFEQPNILFLMSFYTNHRLSVLYAENRCNKQEI